MTLELKSNIINEIEEKKRINYILNEVFKSDYILGRIDNITENGDGFVTICASNNIKQIYKLDGKKWDVYFNKKSVGERLRDDLKKGDLIYFKPAINKTRPEQVIQIKGSTIKKLTDYKQFLGEANVSIEDVILDGDVALEQLDLDNGNKVKLWATQQFYKEFNNLHIDLMKNIDTSQKELKNLEKMKLDLKKDMDAREKEIESKQLEMEQLADKLSFFGFNSFNRENNQEKLNVEYSNYNCKEIFEYVKSYIRNNEKLVYTDDIIRRFLLSIQSKELTILSGPSGTGKTSIVTAFSKSIGAEVKIIPVKPSWTDTEDLIGFYNPIEQTYIPTPFLDALVEAKKSKDKLHLICLDEMNLAHIEYYFAEFLSKLEASDEYPVIELYSKAIFDEILDEIAYTINLMSGDKVNPTSEELAKWCEENGKEYTKEMVNLKKKINFVEKYPALFEIPKNVRFIGTMNVDQTTKHISPKVIDRSFVIELRSDNRENIGQNELEKIQQRFIKADSFDMKNNSLSEDSNEMIKEMENINQQFLVNLSSDFNDRTKKHMKKYLVNIDNYDFDIDKKSIISDLIYLKVLPRINTSFKSKNDEKYLAWNELNNRCKLICTDNINSKLDKMNKLSQEDNILSFWGVY